MQCGAFVQLDGFLVRIESVAEVRRPELANRCRGRLETRAAGVFAETIPHVHSSNVLQCSFHF